MNDRQTGVAARPVHDNAFVEPEIDPRAVLNLLLRRRWVFLGVLLTSLVIGIVITARAPRIYRAMATVLIESHAPDVLGGVREVYDLGSVVYAHEYYQTQYNIIRSVPVAQKVVVALGLNPDSLIEQVKEAGPTPLEARVSGDGATGLPQALQSKLAILNLEGLSSREAIVEKLQSFDVITFLQKQMLVSPIEDSRLVKITIEGVSPERAAMLADAVADAYIELNLDQKIDFTRSAVNWLSDQMRDLKDSLEKSEMALYEFKRANNIISVSMEDRQSMTAQTLSQLNQSLSTTYAQRLALESRRTEIARVQNSQEKTDIIDSGLLQVMNSPLIERLNAQYMALKQEEADLASRYTAEHPRILSLLEKMQIVRGDIRVEITKLLNGLTQEYNTTLGTEQRLKQAIEDIKDEALSLNKQEIEYSRLKRERDNNQGLYELVLKRQKEADLSQMLKVNNVRRLEGARVPRIPVRPNIRMNIAVALLVGFLGGIGVAVLVDFLDSSIKSQEQLEKISGLAFLGVLPAIKGDKNAATMSNIERDNFIVSHPQSSIAECCRSIRTNLLFMSPDKPAKIILVTSSEPREGKSTTVVNLAVSMAQSDNRVLVVDTDMRRPRLHKSFGLPNDVGISTLILGQGDLEVCVRDVGMNLDLLSCGPIPPNPAELLHTDKFRHLVERLAQKYDRVILDSPPVSAVTDASVLSSMADGVVLVVHAGRTTWQAVRHARRRLQDVNARVFGVILNNVDLDDKRSGGYQYYYQYYNYTADEEPGAKPVRA